MKTTHIMDRDGRDIVLDAIFARIETLVKVAIAERQAGNVKRADELDAMVAEHWTVFDMINRCELVLEHEGRCNDTSGCSPPRFNKDGDEIPRDERNFCGGWR